MSIACVERLCVALDASWRATNYDALAFPDLAANALSEARLPEELTPDDIVTWVFGGQELPLQPDASAKFGQPPVTLVRARRFYIDALFWVDGTTTVHQHSFSGAFQVLAGSSIETRFRFDLERNVDGRFVIGQLAVESTSFLKRSDVRTIASGGRLIHSLFHLDRPSVTIVVRTYNDANAGPQFDYARPGVGHDPFWADVARDRALQLVAMLRNTEHLEFERLVGDLMARSDLHTTYRILRECSNMPDRALFDRLLDRLDDTRAREQFQRVFQEGRRLIFLQSRRALVKDSDLRFLLGVLLNAHRRQDVLSLVRAYGTSGNPAATVAGWLRQLSRVTVKLQAAGVPWEPNLLGLPEFTDELELALADVLRGEVADERGGSPLFLSKLRALPALTCLFQ